MKIGIMCAIERELSPILAAMQGQHVEEQLQRSFHIGSMHGVEVVAVMGGVGKVNGAVTAQLLAERYKVDRLIFTGVAGGLDDSLHVGDVVIGTTLLYHDLPMSIAANEVFDIPHSGFESDPDMVKICQGLGRELRYGTIVTGDAFISGGAQRDSIVERLHPLCVDMESTSVAQVCWFYRLPLLIIRSISDFADDSADETFESNASSTAQIALLVMEQVIRSLC